MIDLGKIVRIVVGGTFTIILLCVLFSLSGCRLQKPAATQPVTPAHVENNDSSNYKYIHDTTYVDRWHTKWQKGDTVFIHDSIYVYVGKKEENNTAVNKSSSDTIPVEVEKQLTKNQQFLIRSGIACWVILALLLLAVIVGIVLKFAK